MLNFTDGIGARGSSTLSGTMVPLVIGTSTVRACVVVVTTAVPPAPGAGATVEAASVLLVGAPGTVPPTSRARHSSPGQ
jgi:hypothetical protein